MFNKRRIAISAGSSVAQVIISGFSTFLLYRYLLGTIGPANLGVWALVLAASSTVQAANLGLTGSVIKHIADYDALGDQRKIALAVQTAAISVAAFSFVFALVLFPVARYFFHFSLDEATNREATAILPQALIAFWIYMVTGIYQGALYGCQLIAYRNGLLVADSIMYLLLCVVFAPIYGLTGLAWARVAQNIITFMLSALYLKKYVRKVPIMPHVWRKDIFKEMFDYAVNFQIIAILVMLSDPVTKGFLSRYGNVSMVAYYEMANKLVQLFRSILVNANQVLVPTFAHLKQLDEKNISATYRISYGLVFYFSLPGFCLIAVAAPLISVVWVGHYESVFIGAVVILCAGWLVNVLGVPAYYAGMGTGQMKDNVAAHIVTSVVNIIAILLVGRLWQGMGVVVAWVFALLLGGILLNYLYYRRNSLSLHDIVPKPSRLLALLCVIGTVLGYMLWLHAPEIRLHLVPLASVSDSMVHAVTGAMMIAGFSVIVGIPMWNHPVRRQLTRLVFFGRK